MNNVLIPTSRISARVLNTPIDVLDWSTAIERLTSWGGNRKSAIVCICNVHMTITATQNIALAKVLEAADMVTPDGAPIAWALRRAGFRGQERINGPDLMWRYLSEAERLGQVVSFYGGQEHTLISLIAAIKRTFPGLKIGCQISPPYRPLTLVEENSYVDQINSASTAVLFVGLGCPKQELWMSAHRGDVRAVMVGVGAAFDYHAGILKRAPIWMQKSGLEWFYRLLAEPRRLWKRYLITNTLFILGMIQYGFRAQPMDD